MTERMGIEEHPDIAALRLRYERAAETLAGQVVGGLTFLAGLYVAASPWIVGFNNFTTLTVNNLIAGLAVAVFALGLTSAFGRTHGLAWTAPLVGVWLIISPWVVSGDVARTGSIVSNVIVGAVVLLLGLAAVGLGLQRSFGLRRQARQT
jgi:hypothetical protein